LNETRIDSYVNGNQSDIHRFAISSSSIMNPRVTEGKNLPKKLVNFLILSLFETIPSLFHFGKYLKPKRRSFIHAPRL